MRADVALALFSILALLPAGASPALAGAAPALDGAAETADDETIAFEADDLVYDPAREVVTASGNVQLSRHGYRLTADQIIYDRKSGRVEARGSVLVTEPGGGRVYADKLELDESLREGAVQNILLVLEDGARLAARSGTRTAGGARLNRIVYSPCDVCAETGETTPLWQIKALRVVEDREDGRFTYTGARFELFGVPIAYLPYLSHPTPSRKRATGLLLPEIQIDGDLGVSLELPLYLVINDSSDLTVAPILYSSVNPALSLEYRKHVGTGVITAGSVGTYSSRPISDIAPDDDAQFRGYFYGSGVLQHTPRMRSTFSSRLTTDDTFLRRYDISRDDTLRNFYRFEFFGDQHYLSAEGWAFQGLRQEDDGGETPIALPLIHYEWKSPRSYFGGRFGAEVDSAVITRTDGADTRRLSAGVRWERGWLNEFGQRITTTALVHGDGYSLSDTRAQDALVYTGSGDWQGRVRPLGAVEVSWPLAGPVWGGRQRIEPVLQLVASPAGGNADIPNEDSRAIELEAVNIFSLNRFPGYDRWDGGARMTYGTRWYFDRSNVNVGAQLAQSYSFTDNDGLFPIGTGLAGNFSDIVGRFSVRWSDWLTLENRFRLDKNFTDLRRNEIDTTIGRGRTYLSLGYIRLDRDSEIEDLEDREEARVIASTAVTSHWSLFGSAIFNLTDAEEDPLETADGFEPIRYRVGATYEDECFRFTVAYRQNFTEDRDFRDDTTIFISFALKNLGF